MAMRDHEPRIKKEELLHDFSFRHTNEKVYLTHHAICLAGPYRGKMLAHGLSRFTVIGLHNAILGWYHWSHFGVWNWIPNKF